MSDISNGHQGGPPAAASEVPPQPNDESSPVKPRRGMPGSARSMVISMVVVVAAVIGWLAMVPRVSSVSQPVADVGGIAREISHAQHWDVAVATGLGHGWQATNVRLLTPTHQPKTWQAGYTGPDSAYAAVRQTKNGDRSWVNDQVGGGAKVGTETIAGTTWTKYRKSSNNQLSLVRSTPMAGMTTVVTGTVGWGQLKTFAAALQPYSHTGDAALSALN